MIEDRAPIPIVEWLNIIQNGKVASFFNIIRNGQDKPQRIIAMQGIFPLTITMKVMIYFSVASHLSGQQLDTILCFIADS
jgi:hypothetical protein